MVPAEFIAIVVARVKEKQENLLEELHVEETRNIG